MKLRNKKTGEIGDLMGTLTSCPFIGIGIDFHDGNPKAFYYNSLTELNEEWEDYEPKEPLIKDSKIRKAVRAWGEINDLCGATYSERPNGCAFIFEHADGDKTVICFRSTWLGLHKGKAYGITELCGKEA